MHQKVTKSKDWKAYSLGAYLFLSSVHFFNGFGGIRTTEHAIINAFLALKLAEFDLEK